MYTLAATGKAMKREQRRIYAKITYEVVFIFLAIISVIIAIESMYEKYSPIEYDKALILDSYIQIIFILDYVTRFILADSKKIFVKNNVPDLIAILPFNSLLKIFRMAKIFKITRLLKISKITKLSRLTVFTLRFTKKLKTFFKTNGLIYVIIFAAIVILISGFGFSTLENMSFKDSIWWSFVTATTVGYGDISPTTTGGRVIAVILMFVGIGTIGLLTGTIATYFFSVDSTIDEESGSETIRFITKTKEFTESEKTELINFIKFIKHKRGGKK